MSSQPVIVGLGGQTAVGLDWPSMAAAVRAGIASHATSDYLRSGRSGNALAVCRLPTVPVDGSLLERMTLMAIAAAREAVRPWIAGFERQGAIPVDLPVLLSVPPVRPGHPPGKSKQLAQDILKDLPLPIDRRQSALTDSGHEGGLAALTTAARYISEGRSHAVLVGGVDSYLDIELLDSLERQERLAGEDQPNGFIPGEGAGFVLLCSMQAAKSLNLPILAEFVGGGRGQEPRPWWNKEPTLGEGLTRAFRDAFAGAPLPPAQVRVTYSDVNGESWRAEEWGYAYVRTGRHYASPLDHRHPASFWGDVGAASGPLLAGLAALDLERYFEPGAVALVWAASELQSFRSACLLRRAKESLP